MLYANKKYLQNKKNYLKYYEKKILQHIQKDFKKNKNMNILDIGCGNGNLIFNVDKIYKNANFYGIDSEKKLIKFCKEKFKNKKNFHFIYKNFEKIKFHKIKFDIIIMSGLISYFDNIKIPIFKSLNLLKKQNSKIYIFNRFNKYNIDTIIRYKINNKDGYQKGLNSFSKNTVRQVLKNKKVKINFSKFNIPIVIKKSNNLVNSFTVLTNKKEKILCNKANIIADHYLLEISKRFEKNF